MKYFPFVLLGLAACTPGVETVSTASSDVASQAPAASVMTPVATGDGIPDAFTGRWDASTAACASTSDMKLVIKPKELEFYESSGSVQSVTMASPTDITAVAAMSGEGEQWQRTLRMELGDSGKTLTIDGGVGGVRVRCP
ncbi:hypothetical protein ABI_34240 [Asticcacaulis biprosthecium C19]|uniref:Uncharacterized protein n=1 Tax=Asticcacaulis biprosthecium C19 TaxID=715226 RepID=F4QQB6_9CAUL|nr:hypothetical protein [Asticcacaulis biprosthecium]EGF90403.1 hypothetical protein ABI_34240 [Asticcacaulis biprosthecium C19]